MMPAIRPQALLMSVLLLALFGCSVNPVTGKNELSFMSAQQEIAVGEKNYRPSRQSQGGDYYLNPKLQAYVAGVGRKLAAVSGQPDLPYDFVVLNNSVPNAWALPGGKIAINRGLLVFLEDESQLAAVLAHEVVHAAARHGAQQMMRGTLTSVGLAAAAIGAQGRQGERLYSQASQLGTAAWMAKYGRDDELESDYYGMEYMARAGYEPQGAVELQRTFVKLSEGKQADFISGLFASHPPSAKRVQANIAKAKTLPSGARYRDRYQAAIAPLKKDAKAYLAQDKAIASLKKKQAKAALRYLDGAVALQPREASFWELRGHAWKMDDKLDNAEKAYTTAIDKNPTHFSSYLARGILLYERGQKDRGMIDIKRSYKILPTSAASYYLGEVAFTTKQYQQASIYFQQARQAGGDLGEKANQQLTLVQLQLQPQRFLSANLSYSEQGYLLVTTSNNSPVSMGNIQLKLTVDGQGQMLRLPQVLAAGRQVTLSTGIKPQVNSEGRVAWQVVVIAADPLN